ncbi:hypothetical protein [Borrelia hermsii]|uniref:hypothetical protein n=1 Tax=Borrelia hermsii TaxID=140 RepID=UPI001F3393FE|nr:hypothetical protein [Borrelia hermsii]
MVASNPHEIANVNSLPPSSVLTYASPGINTAYECSIIKDAQYKLSLAMKILIREGSITKNFAALRPIISECSKKYRDYLMFCFDNAHPNTLFNGYINLMVARSIEHGHDLVDVLKIACINSVIHYKIPV